MIRKARCSWGMRGIVLRDKHCIKYPDGSYGFAYTGVHWLVTWLDYAFNAAERVCNRVGIGGTFTTDDIWAELDHLRAPNPDNPKLMANVINGMRRMKIIVSAGTTKTERPERNKGYCTIWRVVA